MDQTTNRLKKFVTTHKTKIAVTIAIVGTAAAAYAISRSSVKQVNDFLEEKGLTEEYYNLDA